MTRAALSLALLAALVVPAASSPVAADLVSHRAAYRLSLAQGSNEAGVTAIRGGLVIEWRAECDGWISNQRLGYAASTEEGEGFSRDTRASSWESRDNTQLRFSIRSFDDGKPSDDVQGNARLDTSDGAGEAIYTQPADGRLTLPVGTLFPTEHVRRLIQAAKDGQRVTTHPVFDGSAPDSLTEVSAVIGAARGTESGGERWPVHLAYFNAGTADNTPEFELSFDLDEGGILYDLTLNLGEFALKAKLEKLERLPDPDCR